MSQETSERLVAWLAKTNGVVVLCITIHNGANKWFCRLSHGREQAAIVYEDSPETAVCAALQEVGG